MLIKMRKTFLVIVIFTVITATISCRRAAKYRNENEFRGYTSTVMDFKIVCIDATCSDKPVPGKPSEFLAWLIPSEMRYTKGGVIVDYWKNPAVVLFENGEFVGLGSPGPDGRWQAGRGDDIIVRFWERDLLVVLPGDYWPQPSDGIE